MTINFGIFMDKNVKINMFFQSKVKSFLERKECKFKLFLSLFSELLNDH
jgi:hypothetical protein